MTATDDWFNEREPYDRDSDLADGCPQGHGCCAGTGSCVHRYGADSCPGCAGEEGE